MLRWPEVFILHGPNGSVVPNEYPNFTTGLTYGTSDRYQRKKVWLMCVAYLNRFAFINSEFGISSP